MDRCYHCDKDLSLLDPHTDEPEPGYWVDSCEDCCTVCAKNEGRKHVTDNADTAACPCCGETNYDDPADCTFCESEGHGDHRPCAYCGTVLHIEQDVWVDEAGGDVCSGDDELVNENKLHTVQLIDGSAE